MRNQCGYSIASASSQQRAAAPVTPDTLAPSIIITVAVRDGRSGGARSIGGTNIADIGRHRRTRAMVGKPLNCQ